MSLLWQWTDEQCFRHWHCVMSRNSRHRSFEVDLMGRERATVALSHRLVRVVERWAPVPVELREPTIWLPSLRASVRRSLVLHDFVDRTHGILIDVVVFSVHEVGMLVHVTVPFVAIGDTVVVGMLREVPIGAEFWAEKLLLRTELEHLGE